MNYPQFLFSFQGRISRQSYWLAWVLYLTANIGVSIIGTSVLEGNAGGGLILVVWLVLAYSSLAVAAKRWHDRNKSGWWSLIVLVPVVGPVWMVIENGFLIGTLGPNRFGPDPVKPVAITHEGQTYLRNRDGTFTDSSGQPIRDAVLVGALGSAFLAARPDRSSNWDSSALDRLSDSAPSSNSSFSSDGGDSGGSGGD